MLSLKKKYRFIKSSLNSPSSSSLNDLENRVVMLCEEFPVEQSLDSGQGSQNHGVCTSQGSRSQGGTSESEPPVIHLSRDRLSYRKACYVETEPNPAHKGFSQKVVQVYGNLSSFHPKMKFFLLCRIYSAQHVHRVSSFIYLFEQDMFNLLKCSVRVPACYQTTLVSLAKWTPMPCASYLCATTHCGNSLAVRSLAQRHLIAICNLLNWQTYVQNDSWKV